MLSSIEREQPRSHCGSSGQLSAVFTHARNHTLVELRTRELVG